jgi:hypothetical protein
MVGARVADVVEQVVPGGKGERAAWSHPVGRRVETREVSETASFG